MTMTKTTKARHTVMIVMMMMTTTTTVMGTWEIVKRSTRLQNPVGMPASTDRRNDTETTNLIGIVKRNQTEMGTFIEAYNGRQIYTTTDRETEIEINLKQTLH